MKYEVKVGRPFEIDAEAINAPSVKVVIESEPKKDSLSFNRMIVYVAIAAIVGFISLSVIYGICTNDYSAIKGLLDSGKNAIDLALKIAEKKFAT